MTSHYDLPPREFVTHDDRIAAHQRAADLGAELAELITKRNDSLWDWDLRGIIDIDADPQICSLRRELWHATWYALTIDPEEKFLPAHIRSQRDTGMVA
jgi:hypothetical protein